jgi:hypothetical protein
MKGKTSRGFKFDIDDKNLDNMELVDCIAELDENPLLLPKACNLLLGKEQKKQLYDHYRAEDGRVPIEDISHALEEIFNASNESKNL